jgi:hypothetical protein
MVDPAWAGSSVRIAMLRMQPPKWGVLGNFPIARIEHQPPKLGVEGSNPSPPAIIFKNRLNAVIVSISWHSTMPDWTKKEIETKLQNFTKVVTIPVNANIESKQKILDMSEMQRILVAAQYISVSNCSCREKVGACNAPLEVCFSINKRAEKFVEKGVARKVSLKEALDTLKRTHDAGLVHVTLTLIGRDEPDIICSCCSCCCHSLGALMRFGMSDAVVASKYVALYNSATCINCGKCLSRC